jgi:hypothetical protein
MSLRPATLTLVLALLHAPAFPAPLAVPLTIEETAGVARHAYPASASVPLPRALVATPDAVWLARPDGAATVAQTRALERWPDGSVRWLLIDFLADVAAGGRATYTLRDGRRPRAPAGPRVRVESRGSHRMLDTGVLRFVVPGDGSGLLAELVVGARQVRGPIPLPALSLAGAEAALPRLEALTVETDGPVRTELLLSGRYAQGVAWELRLGAYAGQPFVRVQHTVTNLADGYAAVRSLPFAIGEPFTAGELGIDGGARRFPRLDAPHELLQAEAVPVLLDEGRGGQHGDGWARASGDGVAVTIATRYFWEEWPKAITLAPDRLRLDLLAGGEEPVRLGSGAAKTHELWIAVEPADHAASAPELAAALRAPLTALPPARWTVATRALPQALAPEAPGAKDFLARLATANDRYQVRVRTERWDDGPPVPCSERPAEHARVGFYGALNWGDWNFPGFRDRSEGCDGWGNLEYDLPQVLALAYVATGVRPFLDGFIPAARHYRDVDVIHHAPGHPEWVGLNHPHKVNHFAWESPTKVDLGHTWTEGLITHYRLTGEVRSLEAARGIADALVRLRTKAGNPRQFGWPMIALAGVYDATGERRYLEAAKAYAEVAVVEYRPTPAAGDWKMGILADGLAAVHALTNDARLRDWLLAYADAFVAERGRFPDPRYALPLGYVAALTGDARYARAALAVAATMKIGEWGKPLADLGRTGFRLLAPLAMPGPLGGTRSGAEKGARPDRGVPRRAPAAGPRSR